MFRLYTSLSLARGFWPVTETMNYDELKSEMDISPLHDYEFIIYEG